MCFKGVSSHEKEFFHLYIQNNSGEDSYFCVCFSFFFFFLFRTATRVGGKPINLKICFPFLFYLQLLITACITMTVFLRTQMDIDILHANYYMGSLFYALVILLVDGIPEVSMTIQRLEVFYKQKTFCFYPAWAYAIPASILKVPISFVESLVWTCLTYYVIGYSPEAER